MTRCLRNILVGLTIGFASPNAFSIELPETMTFSADGTQLQQGKEETTGLYDQSILRTIDLTFKQADWWQQLTDNYVSEEEIAADLTIDGVTYLDVGVRFKGDTSYRATGNSQKKSFNISLDFTYPDQRLMGYKTLNLHNSYSDATFMREVLYFGVMRKYSPVPKASFVKLTINGEPFGIYVHVQQLNSDLIDEWFTNDNGNRWKAGRETTAGGGATRGILYGGQSEFAQVQAPGGQLQPGTGDTTGIGQPAPGRPLPPGGGPPPGGRQPQQLTLAQWVTSPLAIDLNSDGTTDELDYTLFLAQQQFTQPPRGGPGGGNGGGNFASGETALTWLGSDPSVYESTYELKSGKTDDPWGELVKTCNILNNTPLEQLPDTLESVLAVDRWLWFLAVENVFTDEDSYLTKGWDYQFYYDTETGQIHPLEHDGNESFITRDDRLSPVEGESNANRPVISRLLSVPTWRQRYLAHMKTILNESFNWAEMGPKAQQYWSLIQADVLADTKKLSSNADFNNSLTDLESFVNSRRDFLLSHAELSGQAPEIVSVSKASQVTAGQQVSITAQMGTRINASQVFLHYGADLMGRFNVVEMFDDGAHNDGVANDGTYGASIPAHTAGTLIRYYVEARANDSAGTVAFLPAGAEHDTFVYQVAIATAASSPILINEFMASNATTIQDPQGDYDDWIELINVSDQSVDLSGKYLTDREDNLTKWTFPDSTTLAPGAYLIVWADEDGGDAPGLHANFKLSSDGEMILLVDVDINGNTVLDSVHFGAQETDVSIGRYPNAEGPFYALSIPTPNADNMAIREVDIVNADVDGDGVVGFSDFLLFAQQFGKTTVDLDFSTSSDLDQDGTVGFSDFLLFAQSYGKKS